MSRKIDDVIRQLVEKENLRDEEKTVLSLLNNKKKTLPENLSDEEAEKIISECVIKASQLSVLERSNYIEDENSDFIESNISDIKRMLDSWKLEYFEERDILGIVRLIAPYSCSLKEKEINAALSISVTDNPKICAIAVNYDDRYNINYDFFKKKERINGTLHYGKLECVEDSNGLKYQYIMPISDGVKKEDLEEILMEAIGSKHQIDLLY